jgi:hypothetical protein
LQLLRGTLRVEPEVWEPARAPVLPPLRQWLQEQASIARLWHQAGPAAEALHKGFVEFGYSELSRAYGDWQDPLTPERVRLAAVRQTMLGDPVGAQDLLELASLLYEHTDGLLPYSLAATRLEVAAARVRRGPGNAAWAVGAIEEALQILRALPRGVVRGQLQHRAGVLRDAIGAAAGDPEASVEALGAAVELYWLLPPGWWPEQIEEWAQRVDAALVERGQAPTFLLQLLMAGGDAEALEAHEQRLLGRGVSQSAIDRAVREAGYRWPWRTSSAAADSRPAESAGPDGDGG